MASLVRCLHVCVHVFSIHMHTYLSLWNIHNLFINSLLKHNYMFSSIIQFSYFLELMLSSWSVSVLFSSSLLLIPPVGTGAPQKKMLFKVCFMSYTQALFLSVHHQEGSVPFFLHCTRLPGSCLSQTLSQSCTVELFPR